MVENTLKKIEEDNLVSDFREEYGPDHAWSQETISEFNYLWTSIQNKYKETK